MQARLRALRRDVPAPCHLTEESTASRDTVARPMSSLAPHSAPTMPPVTDSATNCPSGHWFRKNQMLSGAKYSSRLRFMTAKMPFASSAVAFLT